MKKLLCFCLDLIVFMPIILIMVFSIQAMASVSKLKYSPTFTMIPISRLNEIDVERKQADHFYAVKNYAEAFRLYKKIVSYIPPGETHAFSPYMIGIMYERGQGTQKNLFEALHWYDIALKNSNNLGEKSEIMNEIGVDYSQLHNNVLSFEYYRQAAKMGSSYGQYNTAYDYAFGIGVIQDYQKAYAWLCAAIAQGIGEMQPSKQTSVAQLKSLLRQRLLIQGDAYDKNQPGKSLQLAQKLAKQYYKLYVLHESIQAKKPSDLSDRINAAIKAFEK